MELKKTGFITFSLKFGLWHAPKQVLRIIVRMIQEKTKNRIVLAEKSRGGVLGYGVIRPLPPKYVFPGEKCAIIGPYFIIPEQRNKGYGSEILKYLISNDNEFDRVYAYVINSNKASIHAFMKNGFQQIGYMKEDNGSYKLSQDATGHVVLCFSNEYR